MTQQRAHSSGAEGHAAAPIPATAESGPTQSTRERILDIALDLFVRKGYAETSLREIAAELGFSKAALCLAE